MNIQRIITTTLVAALFVPNSHSTGMPVFDAGNFTNTLLSSMRNVEMAISTADILVQSKSLFDETKKFYDALKSVNTYVKGTWMVKESLSMVIHMTELQYKGLASAANSSSTDEVLCASVAYKTMIDDAVQATKDLSSYINPTSLSLTDKERLDVVEKCYKRISKSHSMCRYMTMKYAGMSRLRNRMDKNGGQIAKPLYSWDGTTVGKW